MHNREAGLTLLELMVALALGGFLVLGVVNVFLTTRESQSLEASLARVQESGRFAMDILADDLRRSHYTGCNSIHRSADIFANNIQTVGLRGYHLSGGNWSDDLDATDPSLDSIRDDSSLVRDGTDVLNLHIAEHVGNDLLTSDVVSPGATFNLSDNPDCALQTGDVVIFSTCLTAHVFAATVSPACTDPAASTATTVSLNGDNDTSDAQAVSGFSYSREQTEVMRYESVAWFVGDTGRNRNGMDVFALYRQSQLDDNPVEMVEGVESMQVRYGQRVGTAEVPGTRFVAAGDAELEWDEVISVRIGLLIQGYEGVRDANDVRSYILVDPNSPLDPNGHGGGRALRQVFRGTTALRNTSYDR